LTICYNLPVDNVFSELFLKSKPYRYHKSEIILRPDDDISHAYYIEKGFVKIYSLTEDGEERLHIIYKEGDIFPLIGIFSNLSKNVYYEALADVTTRKVFQKDFVEFIKKDPNYLIETINKIIEVFNIHVDRIEELQYSKSFPRLIYELISLANRFGRQTGSSITITVPLSHKDIASSINLTRETVSREKEKHYY